MENNNTNNTNNEFDVKIQIANNGYNRSELSFVKIFDENHKFVFSLYDIEKNIKNELIEEVNGNLNLDVLYNDSYISSGEEESLISMDDDDMITNIDLFNRNSSSTISVDVGKKVVVLNEGSTIKFFSLTGIDDNFKQRLNDIYQKGVENKKSSVHILSHTPDRGMYLTDFNIDDRFLNLDINSNYNDDFLEISNKIISNLNEIDKSGLYLLHGHHGTGKTTYIRHLIRKIDKRVIFISPNMADQISSPDMIPFLMKYPNSVIVIEDSENIIKSRSGGGNQSVSNLLNISDGILGDCLKFQIICTFNTNKEEIDEALTRKGRLIQSYDFQSLDLEKTNLLLKKLGHSESKKPLILSDIYNKLDNNFLKEESNSIGFKS